MKAFVVGQKQGFVHQLENIQNSKNEQLKIT
jgi:hypothetical protein